MNLDRIDQQPGELNQLESALAERHDELARVVTDLRHLYETYCEKARADVSILTEENAGLRQALAEKEQQESDTDVDARPPEVLQEIDSLKAENHGLRQRLQEREDLLDELRQEAEAPREAFDVESYESELNRYRQQLEADRQKLNAEMQQLRTRNEEVDEATREMEMEFSRERAELARERTRLERLREEVRAELEHMQRGTPMRESMMSVHRLRESINSKGN